MTDVQVSNARRIGLKRRTMKSVLTVVFVVGLVVGIVVGWLL